MNSDMNSKRDKIINAILIIIMIVIVVLLLSACGDSNNNLSPLKETSSDIRDGNVTIYRYHDNELNTTCWSRGNGSLFCIPDWQLQPPQK